MKSYYLTLYDKDGERLTDDNGDHRVLKFKAKSPYRAVECASRIARHNGAYSWDARDSNGRELKT